MTSYRTIQGDTWDGIAYKLFGDETAMSALLSANTAHVETVVFGAGVVLAVPEINQKAASELPPWKREG